VRNLKKGRDGEREVAEILDELKSLGCQVVHDIQGQDCNVDHVVICSRGIFVIETKAWSKPDNVWEMDFDDERIHIATRAPEAAPIIQCKAEVGDISLGHRVLLIHAKFVRPFVKTNKNDWNDAAAIFEAAQRPTMRFVAPKTLEQQDLLAINRIRERLVRLISLPHRGIKSTLLAKNVRRGLLRNAWTVCNDRRRRQFAQSHCCTNSWISTGSAIDKLESGSSLVQHYGRAFQILAASPGWRRRAE